jgi:hypothetical protein
MSPKDGDSLLGRSVFVDIPALLEGQGAFLLRVESFGDEPSETNCWDALKAQTKRTVL